MISGLEVINLIKRNVFRLGRGVGENEKDSFFMLRVHLLAQIYLYF